jgi:DNA-binding transcriptional regulator YiaG
VAKKFSELRDKMSKERRAPVESRVQAALEEIPLHELRRARDLTQMTLAKAMRTSQGEVSKIEQRTDVYVSTLRSYLEAMGGELELVARFPDGAVEISQFGELDPVPTK